MRAAAQPLESTMTQIRMSPEMKDDAAVAREFMASQGMASTHADVVRLALRQLRKAIEAGHPLRVDLPASAAPVAKARKPKAK